MVNVAGGSEEEVFRDKGEGEHAGFAFDGIHAQLRNGSGIKRGGGHAVIAVGVQREGVRPGGQVQVDLAEVLQVRIGLLVVVVSEGHEIVAFPDFREDAHPTIAELRHDAHGQVLGLGLTAELFLIGVAIVELGQTGNAATEERWAVHAEVLGGHEGVAVQLLAHLGHDLMVIAVAPISVAGHRCRGVPDPEVDVFFGVGVQHVAEALVLRLGQVDVQGHELLGRCGRGKHVGCLSEDGERHGGAEGQQKGIQAVHCGMRLKVNV